MTAPLRPRMVGATALALVLLAVAVAGLAVTADGTLLVEAGRAAIDDPVGMLVVIGALLAAFGLRALAWVRLLPGLGFGQSLAAVHVALAGNHLLPFRLGEPLRVVSAVRRTPVAAGPATATTVLLRAGDVVALLGLGLVAGPRVLGDRLGLWGVLAAAVVVTAGAVAFVVVVRQRRAGRGTALPGPSTVVLVAGAWVLEAVVVQQVTGWFGLDLTLAEALVVLAAAIAAQLIAVTPGGIGTYEAAAAAALTSLGVGITTAVSAAVAIHAVKTAYSLAAGAVALVRPRPGLLGRGRLDHVAPPVPPAATPPGTHVELFLPAHDEGPRIDAVLAAVPTEVDGHPVVTVVVDDGSTDDTAARARAAGAIVVAHPVNRGLGAAVRTGLGHGVASGAAAVAFCDADGEYDPAQLADLIRPILAGDAHYVVGSRFGGHIRRMHPHRRLGNRVLTWWVRHIVRRPVTDGQSGYRALSAPAAAAATVAHDYNYAQVLTIELVAKGYGYHEVPITYGFRRTGRSFVRLGTYLAHVVPTVWRLLNPDPRSDNPTGPRPGPDTPEATPTWSIAQYDAAQP